MEFKRPKTFAMITAIPIKTGEYEVVDVLFEDEAAEHLAQQLKESVDYVNESVFIERLPLKTIIDIKVNERLRQINKELRDRLKHQ